MENLLAAVEAATKTKKPAKSKTVKGAAKADGLGVLKAAGKGDLDAPAKAIKAKAGKPAKVAKPAKETKMTETTTPDANPLDALIVEFHASDVRDDDFMLALLQKAFDAGKGAKRARAPRAGGPTKRDLAADLLRRPEGCTSKDILDVTGWPAVSVPAIARASGLTLTQKKDGRVTTYFGTVA